ncbi:MAG: tetratricopeptide repeat protein [candidate division Zixibacteria bacterium]|nr:tetratricopeptide repeat protein [candidate division Zixibacteria bacterium]
MDTVTFADPAVIAWINDNVVFAKVNCEDENGEKTEFAKSQGVVAYPTFGLYKSDGTHIDRDVGFIEPEKFVEIFDDFCNGKNTLEYFLKELEAKSDIENNWAVANKYRWRGETERAEEYFAVVIEIDSSDKEGKNSESMYALADMKRREKVYDSAIERYQRLIDKFPSSPLTTDAVIYIAICHRNNGDTTQAIAQFGKFIQLYPESEDVGYASKHIRKLIGEGY